MAKSKFTVETTRYSLKLKFVEELLGSQPSSKVAQDFLEKKAIDKGVAPESLVEEHDALPLEDMVEKGTTTFPRLENGGPMLWNYQVKGMLKEAANNLNGLNEIKAFRNLIEKCLVIEDRRIPLLKEDGSPAELIEDLERPLRKPHPKNFNVMTTALAKSERLKGGCVAHCTLKVYTLPKFDLVEDLLRELLDYASNILGIGQWRNSGVYGKFEYELVKL